MSVEKLLRELYYDVTSPVCYSSARALYYAARLKNKNITQKNVADFLAAQDTYTLHKTVKHRFTKNKTTACGLLTDLQFDLADFKAVASENDNYKYLLCVIDVLSRYAWIEPVKDKTPGEASRAFKKILDSMRRTPHRIYSDDGSEWKGVFKQMLYKRDIQHIVLINPSTHAAMCERFIQTIKGRIWKAFYAQKSRRYVDFLQNIVQSYNNAYHRTIGCAPASVTENDVKALKERLYGNTPTTKLWKPLYPSTVKGAAKPKRQPFRFAVGDKVRVASKKRVFSKKYWGTFDEEIFNIATRLPRKPPVYTITDYHSEPVKGVYYESELVKVLKDDDEFRVEKILRYRTRNGVKEALVSWEGWPAKYNSWEPAKNVVGK